MFFKNSTTPTPEPRSAQGTQTRSIQTRSGIPSLLSADICIRGDVISTGEIQVDGVIEGDVVAECLVVSEAGTVRGAISAATVRVLGTVVGTITASTVKLARTARVSGDIAHKALSIEEGAAFVGHCRSKDADTETAPAGDGGGFVAEPSHDSTAAADEAMDASDVLADASDVLADEDDETALATASA